MEELLVVLDEIKDLLIDINNKLDNLDDSVKDISSNGVYSISDVCSALTDIELNMN